MSRIILSLLLLSWTVQGFVVPRAQQNTHVLKAAKGFGAKETPPPPKKKKESSPAVVAAPEIVRASQDDSGNPFPEQDTDISQGKMALEKLRRGRAEQRNAELRKVKEVQEVDAMMRETPGAAVIPERVAQRMGKRMLPFVGIPLIGGMSCFVGFWYMATYRDMEYEPALVAAATIVLLSVGLVGITYSLMSASWDEDREGSFLGTDEFSKNINNIKEGLTRSRDNAILRDKMDDYSQKELDNLDRKDDSKEKRQQSFTDKLGDELD